MNSSLFRQPTLPWGQPTHHATARHFSPWATLRHHGFGAEAREPLPPLIGCGPSPIDALYEKMRSGDVAAIASAKRLAEREKAGTATAAERSALWGLRALHDEPDEPSDDQTHRCIALLERARKAQPMYGNPYGYGVNPIPMNPMNPGAMNPMMTPVSAFSGCGSSFGARGGGGGGGHPGGGGMGHPGMGHPGMGHPGGFHGGHGFNRGFNRGFNGGGFPFGWGGWGGYGYGCQYVQTPYGLQLACPPQYGYGYPALY